MLEEITLPLPRFRSTSAADAVDVPALVQAHAATLFRVAHSVLRDRAEAEDVVQDTFLRVLQHRGGLPAVREFRPWLTRIAWNLALDRRRKTRPEQADEMFLQTLVAPEIAADQALEETEQTRRVLQAMDRLPGLERQALLLSAIEELSTADIAKVMNKSESAVRALLHRGRTRLRERLGKGAKR